MTRQFRWLSRCARGVAVALAIGWPLHAVSRAEPSSPWGVSPSAALSYAPAVWTNEMLAAGVTSVRGFDDRPQATGLAALEAAGLSVSGILMWSPTQPLTFPVSDLDGFRRYVVEQITRYKGRVRFWEVWNEPPNFTADVSPASYAKVVAAAYDAAKSVDSSVQIGIAAKSTHVSFIAESIASGARGKYDFVSLHPYETAGLLPQGWEGPFLGIVPSVRAMLRKTDPQRADVPVWFSEIGLETSESGREGVTPEVQADTLAKIYTLGLAQGAAHVHWFDPRDSEGRSNGLLRADGTPRPALRALSTLTRVLGKSPVYEGSVAPARDAFGFLFKGVEAAVLVCWTRSETPRVVQLPAAVQVLDPRSGESQQTRRITLSRAPLVLIAAESQPIAKAWQRAARSQSLPRWDEAKLGRAASFTAGRKTEGIHMINPPAPTIVRGRAELDLTGTSGARFAVDPSFLSYDTGPIRITAVVRGFGRGSPGFNLKYEYGGPLAAANDHGMVGSGNWTSIHGDRPVTLSWDIADARFVGKYGANFWLDCDSSAHADFSVLSVRVTKL